MVEIGKRDILDRNRVTMQPFDRGITLTSVDMSFERTPEKLVKRSGIGCSQFRASVTN
jgi:hypothetical protein